MKYWLIIGVKDPRFYDNINQNIKRISNSFNTECVIVETGEGIGLFDHAITQEKPGVVAFLNTALSHVKDKPDDWFVRIDADDYYGPNYLKLIDDARLSGADATGIASVYTKTESGDIYYCESKRQFNGAFGGTIAGRIGSAIEFEETGYPWGEDTKWISSMITQGRTVLPRKSQDYAFVRWEGHNHTYPVSGEAMPHFLNCNAYYQGKWDPYKLKSSFNKESPVKKNSKLAFEGAKSLQAVSP